MSSIFESSRLKIRNFRESDAPAFMAYTANPRVSCFLSSKIETLEAAQVELLKRSTDNSQLAVCLKDNDALIGELFCMKEEPDTFGVGWHFNVQYEGKGYAYESAAALFEYLFNSLEGRRIYAYVEDDNFRSQKLCERLGMRKEGCFMEFVSFTKHEDGTPKYENTCQYALLKKEWLQQLGKSDL